MTHHPASFEIDRAVSGDDPAHGLPKAFAEGLADHLAKSESNTAATAPSVILAAPAPKRAWAKKLLLGAAAIVVVVGGARYGYDYWTTGRFLVSTDDAYVQADTIAISPKISGYLAAVLIGDNAPVKAGQVLARIDDRDYQIALQQADADVEAASAAIDSKQAAIESQQSTIDSAKATIDLDHANETFAAQENSRYAELAVKGFGSVQNAQQAAARISGSRASVQRDAAALASAVKQVDTLKAELAQARAARDHAVAVRNQAKLNLEYTVITAPADGVVGNRTLRVGQYVQAGTQLMNIVPRADAYVVANYKETQLTNVRRGQPVDIEVDMFPGHVYHGHVDSLSPATGQTFALLPPDNATGNFTKIVQRIPVKILLDAESAAAGDLSPGMSVTPSIDTKAPAGSTKLAESH